jgi:hypothetical protein
MIKSEGDWLGYVAYVGEVGDVYEIVIVNIHSNHPVVIMYELY